jgi:hypothetical protein
VTVAKRSSKKKPPRGPFDYLKKYEMERVLQFGQLTADGDDV